MDGVSSSDVLRYRDWFYLGAGPAEGCRGTEVETLHHRTTAAQPEPQRPGGGSRCPRCRSCGPDGSAPSAAPHGGWGANGGVGTGTSTGTASPLRPPPGHGSAPPARGRGRGRLARSFPAERRRPAACQPHLAPGGHLERPVGRDRRRGFLSFLKQLVIDFPGETSLHSGGPVTSHQPQPGRNRWGVNFGGEGGEGTASLFCSLLSQSVQGWKRDGKGRI